MTSLSMNVQCKRLHTKELQMQRISFFDVRLSFFHEQTEAVEGKRYNSKLTGNWKDEFLLYLTWTLI